MRGQGRQRVGSGLNIGRLEVTEVVKGCVTILLDHLKNERTKSEVKNGWIINQDESILLDQSTIGALEKRNGQKSEITTDSCRFFWTSQ
jgi:hypothetical protein